MEKGPALPGGTQALLLGDIYRRLRKGARGRHTTLYRQYTDIVYGLSGRRGKTGILDTPAQGSLRVASLRCFSSH